MPLNPRRYLKCAAHSAPKLRREPRVEYPAHPSAVEGDTAFYFYFSVGWASFFSRLNNLKKSGPQLR